MSFIGEEEKNMVNFEFGRRTKDYVPFAGLTVTCQGVHTQEGTQDFK